MNFPAFLALRYLKPKRTVISFITLFCVGGVMLGVGALIVVISVMNGFQEKIREELLSIEPHLVAVVHPAPEGTEPAEDWRSVAERLRKLTGDVVNVTACIEVPATLEIVNGDGEKRLDPVQVTAVDPATTDLAQRLRLSDGAVDLDSDNAIIPEYLANQWGFFVGDKIVVQSFRNAEEAYKMIDEWEKTPKDQRGEADAWMEKMKQVVQPSELTVTGIYRSRQRGPIFAPLHIGDEMMAKGGKIDFLGITTPDPLAVGRFRDAVERELPLNWTCDTWRERHREYFDAVESERGMMYVLLMLIMIVAAFCIVVTLATVAIHKRKEIGVVRSLGARLSQIIAIFVTQGTIVGFLGTICGILGGLLFLQQRMNIKAAVQVLFGVEILDPAVYGVPEIPCDVRLHDVLLISGIALVVSTLAGIIPALMAAAQDPAKSLRSE